MLFVSADIEGADESNESREKTGEGWLDEASDTASAVVTAAFCIPLIILSSPSNPVRLLHSLSGKAR